MAGRRLVEVVGTGFAAGVGASTGLAALVDGAGSVALFGYAGRGESTVNLQVPFPQPRFEKLTALDMMPGDNMLRFRASSDETDRPL